MATPTRYYSSTAVLNHIGNAGGISSGATTMFCSVTPSGYPGSFPFTLVLEEGTANEELVNVTAGAGTSGSPWTIQRAFDGTTSKSHAINTTVSHPFAARDMTDFRLHESLDSTTGSQPHGLPVSAWSAASFAVFFEQTLSNSTTVTINIPSIPQTNSHLMVVAHGRLTSNTAQDGFLTCVLNGDTAARYSRQSIVADTEGGSQAGPTANNAFSQSKWDNFILMAASQAGSSVNGGGGYMIIPNYTAATLNKMAVGSSGYGNATAIAGKVGVRWAFYNPVSQVAITSMTLAASIGNFQSGTFIGLYGLG